MNSCNLSGLFYQILNCTENNEIRVIAELYMSGIQKIPHKQLKFNSNEEFLTNFLDEAWGESYSLFESRFNGLANNLTHRKLNPSLIEECQKMIFYCKALNISHQKK
jgi:hypothetical protein